MIPLTTNHCQLTTDNNFFSPYNRLKFGNYLYKDKDYLRAASEFKKYLKINSSDTVQFRLSNSFFKIGRFTEAADNFKGLFFSSTLSEKARLMFFESIFFQSDFNTFRDLADQDVYLSQKYREEIERLKFTTYFFDNVTLPAENIILGPFPDSVQSQIAKFYIRKKIPLHKSPTTAAILSTLLPGAGKIYTGEVGDGITALVTTALSAYLAYTNFKAGHQFRGWLFTGMTAFFYGGNIYGSAASAQIYNARIRFDFDKEVRFYFEQRNYFLPQINP
jgi:TM2 domain-containing membrane protein YozV